VEFNLKRDINKTIEMMEKDSENELKEKEYSKVYSSSVINHKDLYPSISSKFGKFLGILGSTAPALNAIYMGAKDLTCFDISFPACYYAYFQIAAILSLEYEEYLEFMYNHQEHKSFNFDTYQKIRDELYVNGDMDSKKYFDALYVHKGEEKIRKHFFVELNDFLPKEIYQIADSELSLYFKKESFYILKEKLKNISLKIFQEDVRNIPELMQDKRFDFIYMSCAHRFIYEERSIKNLLDYISLLEQMKQLLEKDGTLQAGYFYMKEALFDPIETCQQMSIFEQNGYQRINVDSITKRRDVAYVYKKY